MRALRDARDPDLRVMVLSARSRELLARPIRGQGGFQRILRRLQSGVDGAVLLASIADVNALVRLSTGKAFRQLGGFQQVALALLTDVVTNENAFPEGVTGQQRLPFGERRGRAALTVIRGGRR